jgi:transglutaminase-like putative cysteine protease
MAVLYRIEHDTRYAYASTVSMSHHVACLRPREQPRQHVREYALVIEPAPARILHRQDFFGNDVAQFQLVHPHGALHVSSRSLVEVTTREPYGVPEMSPPWTDVRDALQAASRAGCAVSPAESMTEAVQFLFASPYVALGPELEAFGRVSFPPGRPLLAAALDLMHRIYREFRFDPIATSITTPVTRVLAERHGVCQDFAHLQISCLRALGLAARYVSGYLLTDPPAGQPRLIGADASHAWLSVYCPPDGWVDLDPTNDLLVDQRHVTVAWGRDYGDVSPLRGVLLGGDEHILTVGVSVVPVDLARVPDSLDGMSLNEALSRD